MRHGSSVGAALALCAAALVVALQPIRDPWWHWADPDGAYVGSSLNILLGNHTDYLDHPGLPTQDALAIAFYAEYAIERATGRADSKGSFVDEQMLDLDQARPLYRSWALFLFFGATLLVYLLISRLLGHWAWGLAGSLMFVSTPALAPISFLLRPDATLAALCLAIGYLTVIGFEQRSAVRYTAASVLLGFALTVKIPALGMAAPLALAAAWRPPTRPWFRETAPAIAARARRHLFWLAPAAFAWIVLCWLFNRERLPIVQTDDQRSVLVYGAVLLGGYAIAALLAERLRIPWTDHVLRLFYAWLLLAFAVGVALPATLVLDDGVQMLVAIKETLTGGRVNEDIEPFGDFRLEPFLHFPLAAAAIVIALGLIAGVVDIAQRRYRPFLLALGTLVLATMAAARYSYDYYYVPAFAVAIPGSLWLVSRLTDRRAAVYALLPALLLFGLSVNHERGQGSPAGPDTNATAQALADEILRPGEVILVSSYYFPIEDVRFGSLVDGFVDYVPEYPYRFLSRPEVAAERGLKPAYYVASAESLPASGEAEIDINGYGPFVIKTLPIHWGPEGAYGVARILKSPAIER
jgi:hypothetical protein